MNVRESLLRDLGRLVIWYPVRWTAMLLPVKLAFRFFEDFGSFHFRFRPGSLQRLKDNLGRSKVRVPGTDLDAIILRYLANHYVDRLHLFLFRRLRRMTEQKLHPIIRLEGEEHLHEVLRGGKGAIILQGHFGPVQLPLFSLAARGYAVYQVRNLKDEGLSWVGRHVAFRIREKLEDAIPVTMVAAKAFQRPLFESLKNNGVLLMSGDGTGGGQFVGSFTQLEFLGRQFKAPLGAYSLALKTGAPILPAALRREATGSYVFNIEPPLPREEDPEAFARTFLAWFEQKILESPELWHFWDEFEDGKMCVGRG